MITRSVIACLLMTTAAASAEPDGYCDFVEGSAGAASATDLAPELFTSVGYLEQSDASLPPSTTIAPRLIGGVRYRLTGIYQGIITRERAHADCRRHEALSRLRGTIDVHALEARARVLEAALTDSASTLKQDADDLQAQRTTARETNATRLRIEELRSLATDARRQIAALPVATTEITGVLAAYQRADGDIERAEGTLRRIQAFDVTVRFGIDQRFDANAQTSYFAVLGLSANLGTLLQGSSNARAAAGRATFVRSGHDVGGDVSVARLRAIVDIETKRVAETDALVEDLRRQLDQLGKLAGNEARRYGQTLWFDLIKAQAESAYLTAHLESLHQVLAP